jgi:hypothetical protein
MSSWLGPEGGPVGDSFWGDTRYDCRDPTVAGFNPLTQEEMAIELPWSRMASLTEREPWVVLARTESQART